MGSDPMPWNAIAVLSPILIGAGGLMAWLGRRSNDGELDRNWVAGIRTSATLASDEAWRAAHLVAGRFVIWAGILCAAVGATLLLRPSNTVGAVITLGGMATVVLLVTIGGIRGDRAARLVLQSESM